LQNNIPILSNEALTPWFDKIALVHECVAQVRKDLGSYGIQLEYSGVAANAYEELFVQLQPQISSLLHSSTQLMEILYRVDVSEVQVQKAVESNEGLDFTLTRLILWRELQKVVTRFLLQSDHSTVSEFD
jgi:hypothetical protein